MVKLLSTQRTKYTGNCLGDFNTPRETGVFLKVVEGSREMEGNKTEETKTCELRGAKGKTRWMRVSSSLCKGGADTASAETAGRCRTELWA